MNNLQSTRDGFGKAVLSLGKKHKNLYVLSADLRDSLRVGDFAKELPNQFVECGVAEQNMVGMAAGLSMNGIVPFATSFAVFSPGRTWGQIKISVCLSNLPVKIVGGYGGFGNYKDGASHHALEDIALMRVLPRMKIFTPADFNQAAIFVDEAFKDKHPNYIRLSGEQTGNFINNKDFKVGKAQVVRRGGEVTIISYGPMLFHALNAVKKSGVKATVLNMHTIKPLDKDSIKESLDISPKVMVIEDHQIYGGLGSAVAEVLSKTGRKHKLKILGVKNKFGRSARNIEDLYKYFKLDEETLSQKIKKFVG